MAELSGTRSQLRRRRDDCDVNRKTSRRYPASQWYPFRCGGLPSGVSVRPRHHNRRLPGTARCEFSWIENDLVVNDRPDR